jgi:hypothetical protein
VLFLANNSNIKTHLNRSNIEYNFRREIPNHFAALLSLPPFFQWREG